MKKFYGIRRERGTSYRFAQTRASSGGQGTRCCFAQAGGLAPTRARIRLLVICVLVCLSGLPELQAQWNTSGNDIYNTNSGNVGIGNTTPTFKLDITGHINSTLGYKIGGYTVLAIPGNNTFVGRDAGSSNTTGVSNTFSGYEAGRSNTTGNSNTFSGYEAGRSNTTGLWNTFSGYQAGYSNMTSSFNTFNGYQAGYYNTTGHSNTFNGTGAGLSNTIGAHNTFSGIAAGSSNTEGNSNTFSGAHVGRSNTTGSQNTFSGYEAGRSNTTGSGNVFLGYRAGYNELGSNKLYISNSNTSAPLIYGEFDNNLLRVNGQLEATDTVIATAFIGDGSQLTGIAGLSQWDDVSGGINYTSGNVGIGTAAPAHALDVAGDVNSTQSYLIGGDTVLAAAGFNTFVGKGAGASNTTGRYNTFSGYQAGNSNTEGVWNTFSGFQAGSSNTTGSFNTFNGYLAGRSNTTGGGNTFSGSHAGASNTTGNSNTFSGSGAGNSNTEGNQNTFSGYRAGISNTTGSQNTFSGQEVGYSNTEGSQNTFSGSGAGYFNTTGSQNTFSGQEAGYSNMTGSDNVFLGRQSGYRNTTGNGSVFLGHLAGYFETGSNKLYIDNSSTSSPLIYGEFDNNLLRVNGQLEATDTVTATAFVGDGSQLTGIAGLSQWDDVSGGINYASGNVGIGTAAPAHALDVAGDVNSTQSYLIGGDTVLATPGVNTFVGRNAGFSNTTGNYNTFSGTRTGYYNTEGSWNTFSGTHAGYSNTTGNFNTFSGTFAGYYNTTGSQNTFSGTFAGYSNTTGSQNTFSGTHAGYYNTEGHSNTFSGTHAGYSNTTGSQNAFSGTFAGYSNTTGNYNTFSGTRTGYSNTEGSWNTFSGTFAGFSNTTGNYNTFSGSQAGYSNTTGINNTFNGSGSGFSNVTGSGNVFLGYQAGYFETGSGRLYIANDSTSNPLIYGEFDNDLLRINGQLEATDTVIATAFIGDGSQLTGIAGLSQWDDVPGGINYTSGNVGIGTATPLSRLHVAGGNLLLDNGQFLTATRSDNGFAQQLFGMDGNNDVLLNRSAIVHGKVSRTIIGFNSRSFDVRNGSNQVLMRTMPSGNVGIGTSSPGAKLEVAGQVKITGGSPGAGKVLTSDADGLASWESLSALSAKTSNDEIELLKAELETIKASNVSFEAKNKAIEAENVEIKERLAALEARLGAANPAPTTAARASATTQEEALAHEVRGAVLYQNTPNPFDKSTVIRYVLPEGIQHAGIIIYNMNGEQLMAYDNLQGSRQLEINGHILKAGIYLYSLIADGKEVDTKRMILTK